ncbi:MAG: hypothetical protein M1383_05190 [Patescibacteria group bacterium]|nr:hypothetical protein [Patescibacteria group bacterium]
MSEEIKINRVQSSSKAEYSPAPAAAEPGKKVSNKVPWIILGVIIVLLVAAGVLFRGKLFGKDGAVQTGAAASKPSGYQAVFLTNGQVYFGKLSDVRSNYVTLKDIYYLQVGPQQGSGTGESSSTQQSISLVKLGSELHGPVDQMHISNNQILFYEDLKSDGQVVKAITQDKASQQK